MKKKQIIIIHWNKNNNEEFITIAEKANQEETLIKQIIKTNSLH